METTLSLPAAGRVARVELAHTTLPACSGSKGRKVHLQSALHAHHAGPAGTPMPQSLAPVAAPRVSQLHMRMHTQSSPAQQPDQLTVTGHVKRVLFRLSR